MGFPDGSRWRKPDAMSLKRELSLRRVAKILVLLSLPVVFGLALWQLSSDRDPVVASPPTRALQAPDPRTAPGPKPVMLVIADSIALVSNGNEQGQAWPSIVADRMGWSEVTNARSGRGFLTSTIGGFPVASFDADLPVVTRKSPHADYVIIDGGRNDISKPQGEVFAAMSAFYDRVRAAYPDAKIVAVVPAYISERFAPDSNADYGRWSSEVTADADRIGARVVDPIAEGWYRGVDVSPYLWTDGVHLNAAGEGFYAGLLVDSLKRLGVA